jgi:hypothetical protein
LSRGLLHEGAEYAGGQLIVETGPQLTRTASLPELLASRARRASDLRLAVDAGGGLIALVAAVMFQPPLWASLASVGAAVMAYGAWGILDRELADGTREAVSRGRGWLRGARAAAAVLGALAALVAGVSFFFAALGTWIS